MKKFKFKDGLVITASTAEEAKAKHKVTAAYVGIPDRLVWFIKNDSGLNFTEKNNIELILPNRVIVGRSPKDNPDRISLGYISKDKGNWIFCDEYHKDLIVFTDSDGDVVNQDIFRRNLAYNIRQVIAAIKINTTKKLDICKACIKRLKA